MPTFAIIIIYTAGENTRKAQTKMSLLNYQKDRKPGLSSVATEKKRASRLTKKGDNLKGQCTVLPKRSYRLHAQESLTASTYTLII